MRVLGRKGRSKKEVIMNQMKKMVSFFSFMVIVILGIISCNNTSTYYSILVGEEITNAELEQYTKEEKDFNGYSSQGGILYEYKEKEKIVARVVYSFGEMGKVKYTFEEKPNGMVFIVESIYTYDKSIYDGDVEIVYTDTSKYVLHKGKVYHLVNKKVVEFKDTSIIDSYNIILSIL